MASEQEVLYEVLEGGIAVITLNRPHRLNALTPSMSKLYFDCLNKANADNDIKAIIVTGQGRGYLCIYIIIFLILIYK